MKVCFLIAEREVFIENNTTVRKLYRDFPLLKDITWRCNQSLFYDCWCKTLKGKCLLNEFY